MTSPQIVLVLQGGGALGAYQSGVYEAMREAGIEPDWVIGTSIGAVQAALIAGNEPTRRLDRLRQFWDTIAHKGLSSLWAAAPGFPAAPSTVDTVARGLPGFFSPNLPAWLHPQWPLGEENTGYYRTDALRRTLDSLLDATRLAAGSPRLTVGAVNVRSGAMHYFDSRDHALGLDHVLASGALPPAFPPVRVGDELYWDGGIYSNTPVEAVFDDMPRRDSLIFAVQLWQPQGEPPQTMWQVGARQKEIQFASRVDSHVQRQAQLHRLRHIIRELAAELPRAARSRRDVQEMLGYGCGTVMHLMRFTAPRLPGEDQTKDLDFQPARIRTRWQAGLDDGRRLLARQPWLAPADPMEGLVVHDAA